MSSKLSINVSTSSDSGTGNLEGETDIFPLHCDPKGMTDQPSASPIRVSDDSRVDLDGDDEVHSSCRGAPLN
jgi:hypothetical protein